MYRIKHIPSGLYYSPGPSKLTPKGKIYHNGPDAITYFSNYVECRISLSVAKKLKENNLEYLISKDRYNQNVIKASINQFEREQIN